MNRFSNWFNLKNFSYIDSKEDLKKTPKELADDATIEKFLDPAAHNTNHYFTLIHDTLMRYEDEPRKLQNFINLLERIRSEDDLKEEASETLLQTIDHFFKYRNVFIK